MAEHGSSPPPSPPQLHPGARRIIKIDASGTPQIVIDHWQRLTDDEALPDLDALPVLVSIARAQRDRAQLDARPGSWGVWITGDAEPAPVVEAFGDRPLIAIVVAKFGDGRYFSLARLLRERHGYRGELRAVGNVLPDQLFFMRRCGFGSFELQPGKSLETGLRSLAEFTVTYQGAADDPRPLYRRRG
jgi:uncharacterized protein (DUF934 family)